MGHHPRHQGYQHHRGGPRRQHDVVRPDQGHPQLLLLPPDGCHGESRRGCGCDGIRRCRPHRGDSGGLRGELHPQRLGRPAGGHQHGQYDQRGSGPRLHPNADHRVHRPRTLSGTGRADDPAATGDPRKEHVQSPAGLQAHDGTRPDGRGDHAAVRLHAGGQYRTGKGVGDHRTDQRHARFKARSFSPS